MLENLSTRIQESWTRGCCTELQEGVLLLASLSEKIVATAAAAFLLLLLLLLLISLLSRTSKQGRTAGGPAVAFGDEGGRMDAPWPPADGRANSYHHLSSTRRNETKGTSVLYSTTECTYCFLFSLGERNS